MRAHPPLASLLLLLAACVPGQVTRAPIERTVTPAVAPASGAAPAALRASTWEDEVPGPRSEMRVYAREMTLAAARLEALAERAHLSGALVETCVVDKRNGARAATAVTEGRIAALDVSLDRGIASAEAIAHELRVIEILRARVAELETEADRC